MNELHLERFIDFAAQRFHVNIDNVNDGIETLIPHVIENHGPRKYVARRA